MSFSQNFFTSSQNGTPAPLGASLAGSPDKAKARSEEKQTSLPVTIRAIEDAVAQDGEELRFFGSQPETLVLVACVETLNKLPNNLDLVVNDGSGRLRVRQFLSADSATQTEGIEAGRYVHMFGQVRSRPELHFVAQAIRPAKSADEVSYHVIECAHAALKLQRGPAAPPAQTTPTKAAPPADLTTSTFTPAKMEAPPATAAAPQASPAALAGAALREALMTFLAKQGEVKGDVGVSREEVYSHFKTASEIEVGGLLSEMVTEGDAITTIDDDHFAAM